MRQSDLFGRVGGEEFAALLPHTALDGARSIAERLLQQTRRHPAVWAAATAVQYSVSVGVAALDPSSTAADELEALMAAADQALYRAKALGRDRLELAGG
jgi:diguanylate cyclase (GGDEF)-like protein